VLLTSCTVSFEGNAVTLKELEEEVIDVDLEADMDVIDWL